MCGLIMMPPECRLCGKDFDPFKKDRGLVYFKRTESDIEWDRKMEQTGMVGHPPYAVWFCKKHYKKAKALENLSRAEAMAQLKAP